MRTFPLPPGMQEASSGRQTGMGNPCLFAAPFQCIHTMTGTAIYLEILSNSSTHPGRLFITLARMNGSYEYPPVQIRGKPVGMAGIGFILSFLN
jgi:hypothetical protein